ncbi:Hypothetical protein FKW44_019939 [Caligus rogercresseyi]|uniref:Uncharacterized protein n=1 Tax=Caligus rogercresseyi TaxID=217165 RepID=A0A7T8GWJ5_CALRO|nr:Hypothetical protein FKW44_019939 [Caligus rogercresseyi]
MYANVIEMSSSSGGGGTIHCQNHSLGGEEAVEEWARGPGNARDVKVALGERGHSTVTRDALLVEAKRRKKKRQRERHKA